MSDKIKTEEINKQSTDVSVESKENKMPEIKQTVGNSQKRNPNGESKQVSSQRLFSSRRKNSLGDNFEERVVKIKRINKTTKGGRRMRFSALVIVGNKNGRVGYGIGKSIEVPGAIKKAVKNARKNLVSVPMTKKYTIHHEILCHNGATKVLLKPAKDGTGIIAGGVIRDVIELAGYKNLYSKNLGSNTSLNMASAVIDGLLSQLNYSNVMKARDLYRTSDNSKQSLNEKKGDNK